MGIERTAKERAWDEGYAIARKDLLERIRATEIENGRLRYLAQSRYELLRECQAEFKAIGSKGLVETIETALAQT